VPVVAITSDTSDLRAVAERSGWFASVLTKPLAPADLLEAVREAIAESPKPIDPLRSRSRAE
jgi:CheY-like chemotaxis protein